MSRIRKPHVVLKTGAASRPVVTTPPAPVTPALAPEHARFLDLLAAELDAALRESSALPSHQRITARLTRVREGLMRIAASGRAGGHA
jgi:hypothetical protein